MKTMNQGMLVSVGQWASCVIFFGLGYLILRELGHFAAAFALMLTSIGALAKLVVMRRLERLSAAKEANSSR